MPAQSGGAGVRELRRPDVDRGSGGGSAAGTDAAMASPARTPAAPTSRPAACATTRPCCGWRCPIPRRATAAAPLPDVRAVRPTTRPPTAVPAASATTTPPCSGSVRTAATVRRGHPAPRVPAAPRMRSDSTRGEGDAAAGLRRSAGPTCRAAARTPQRLDVIARTSAAADDSRAAVAREAAAAAVGAPVGRGAGVGASPDRRAPHSRRGPNLRPRARGDLSRGRGAGGSGASSGVAGRRLGGSSSFFCARKGGRAERRGCGSGGGGAAAGCGREPALWWGQHSLVSRLGAPGRHRAGCVRGAGGRRIPLAEGREGRRAATRRHADVHRIGPSAAVTRRSETSGLPLLHMPFHVALPALPP